MRLSCGPSGFHSQHTQCQPYTKLTHMVRRSRGVLLSHLTGRCSSELMSVSGLMSTILLGLPELPVLQILWAVLLSLFSCCVNGSRRGFPRLAVFGSLW